MVAVREIKTILKLKRPAVDIVVLEFPQGPELGVSI